MKILTTTKLTLFVGVMIMYVSLLCSAAQISDEVKIFQEAKIRATACAINTAYYEFVCSKPEISERLLDEFKQPISFLGFVSEEDECYFRKQALEFAKKSSNHAKVILYLGRPVFKDAEEIQPFLDMAEIPYQLSDAAILSSLHDVYRWKHRSATPEVARLAQDQAREAGQKALLYAIIM